MIWIFNHKKKNNDVKSSSVHEHVRLGPCGIHSQFVFIIRPSSAGDWGVCA